MRILQNKSTRALIIIMSALVLLGVSIAKIYYAKVNASIDPRIREARILYEKYNGFAQLNQLDSILALMDEVEHIYHSTGHYQNSFETGVLYNNRAASYLIMAFHYPAVIKDSILQDSIVNIAEYHTKKSITIYTNWLSDFEGKEYNEIESLISESFLQGLDNYDKEQNTVYLENRIKEIQEAQLETSRRLSVSYTNLGVIFRYRKQYEQAAKSYKKAIDLWDQNLTAENNLNILLNRPLKKRNFIQRLFPPERK